ncbi:zinc finger, C3HC4 type [Onchocerca flexuosa]|uniref:RING-type E3 ubiquitin transferase n=2 Tax=Onchocerca flexuosa TaxID=387005 RepID=A0A238BV67_9BILA|nr:zinc finger, C3HC4 type [Onchocerca flexuosa]
MVSGRSDGPPISRRLTLPQSTSYDKSRKPHALRTGVDTKSIQFDWISKELECGICEKTIQNTMVVRNCMHRFCADCILQRIHTGARKCPSCHKVLPKKAPLKSDANFDAIINKFTLSIERRCVKRPITESSNLCFTKKRIFDKKSPTKCLTNPDPIAPSSSSERTLPKNTKASLKYESMTDSASNTLLEIKPPLLTRMHSDMSDSPLTIDEGSSYDTYSNLQQPTTSSYAKCEDRSNVNDAGEKKAKSSRLVSNHCEITPVVVLQKSSSHERLNGVAVKNVQVNGKKERSAKCVNIYPSLGPSAHTASNQIDSNMNLSTTASISGISNGSLLHVNGNIKRTMNPKMSDGLFLTPSLGSSILTEDLVMMSPRSSEYLLMSGKQRLSSGIESELVLNPDASVVNDDSLPIAAKHLRYIVTCPTTTVGHLCEYILQRIKVESRIEWDRKCTERCLPKRVLLCPVKSDLALDDVLVVNETGEGQFTTINVGERNSDPKSASIFTINSPFAALDESITIEQLKAEYWANRKRPLKLIFKFTEKS